MIFLPPIHTWHWRPAPCNFTMRTALSRLVKLVQAARHPLRPTIRLTAVCLTATALLGLLAWISYASGTPIATLTRDPLAVANAPVYWGVLSNLGILLWAGAAAVSLFAVFLLKRLSSDREGRRFLLLAGLLTTFLGLDDLFMFHERVFPTYLLMRERYVLLFYVLLMLGLIWSARRVIRESFHLPLLLACFFFMGSLAIDKVDESTLPMHHIFEDGAKFLGIVFWCYYLCHTAAGRILCR